MMTKTVSWLRIVPKHDDPPELWHLTPVECELHSPTNAAMSIDLTTSDTEEEVKFVEDPQQAVETVDMEVEFDEDPEPDLMELVEEVVAV